MLKHIGLFEGIGGFSLAADWAGWQTIAWCEWDKFCQQVLSYHFPKANKHGNIKETDFTIYRGKCDIVTGGFPCQPYSLAGKRKGKEDDRHLWPEMLRAIREIQPRWVVGENVFGLINWSGGMVFDEVQADLEAEGYEVWPYVLPACAVNAPHRRDRVWFVAYAKNNDNRKQGGAINRTGKDEQGWHTKVLAEFTGHGNNGDVTHPCNQGLQGSQDNGNTGKIRENGNKQFAGCLPSDWAQFPTQSPICTGNDGVPVGLDGITFPKWRNESIKAAGNAVVPQVVYEIFKAINEYEKLC